MTIAASSNESEGFSPDARMRKIGAPRARPVASTLTAGHLTASTEQPGSVHILKLPSPEELRTVRKLAATVSQAALEVLGGTRAVQQLSHFLAPAALQILDSRAALTERARENPSLQQQTRQRKLLQSPHIRSVRGCWVAPGIYELSVIAADRHRHRALALRVEQQSGNWLVTVLQIG